MQNMYEDIRTGLQYNKFMIGDLLFVEYTCPVEEDLADVWSKADYFVHVLSGKKSWRTANREWVATQGETLYIKKGAYLIEQSFEEDFCILVFFVSDNFIKDIVREVSEHLAQETGAVPPAQPVIEVTNDTPLSVYFQSMLTYFMSTEKPPNSLLSLKMKALIISILLGDSNKTLSAYFQSLLDREKPSLTQTMESNFCYNLSMDDFAKLCNRSLSSFKRDFLKYYNMPPGKWLQQKRLEYSAVLLKNADLSVSQVGF